MQRETAGTEYFLDLEGVLEGEERRIKADSDNNISTRRTQIREDGL